MYKTTNPKTVLVIGSTGQMGIDIILKLNQQDNQPTVHAFARNPEKLANIKEIQGIYQSAQQGDAASSEDLERALRTTQADTVIVSVGNGDNLSKKANEIRTANAKALVKVLKKPKYSHVEVCVVSSSGAGSSHIIVGMGVGKAIGFMLRHVLHDHTGQEKAFQSISDRVYVVRATSLTDGCPTGKLVEYGDMEKVPSLKTDRADLAELIASGVCGKATVGGRTVNVTGVKQ